MTIIGIDFDNTIISYDNLFRASAAGMDISVPLTCTSKEAIRNHLRTLDGGEIIWQKIQADVYGKKIVDATIISGFEDFVKKCRLNRLTLYIVSHKTRFAAQAPEIDLQSVAMKWMKTQGFFRSDSMGFKIEDINFETTRERKVERITSLGCTVFIDDMIEVLQAIHTPLKKILLSDRMTDNQPADIVQVSSWPRITNLLFGGEN